MSGTSRVFISHSDDDTERCRPLLAALDAWGVSYVFERHAKDMSLQLSGATQAAITESVIFLRICTAAIRRSYWMSLEAGAFLGLQSDDHRQGRGDQRTLINLVLDRDYVPEPFDRAGLLIDATKETDVVWVNRLRGALGLPPLPEDTKMGLGRMVVASGVTRRRLLAAGAAAAVVAVAAGAAGVSASGVLQGPKGYVPSTPTPTPRVRTKARPLWTVGLGQPISAGLAFAGATLFVGAWDGKLHALDIANRGRSLWSFTASSQGVIYAPPVVAGGLVYTHAHVNGAFQEPLYALRIADGSVAWTTGTPSGAALPLLSFAVPLVRDGTLYLPSSGIPPTLMAPYDAATGAPRPADNSPAGLTVTTPAIAGDLLYCGGTDGYLYALDITRALASAWRVSIADAPAGTPVAGVDTATTSISSSPTVDRGVVYIGSGDHTLYAVDAATGKIRWRYATGDAIEWSTPAVANGVVYVGSDDHALHAVDAQTGKGRWKYQAGGKIWSSPAVANGVVYVGSDDHNVYALDAASGQPVQVYQTSGRVVSAPRVVNGVLYFASYDNYVYAFPI